MIERGEVLRRDVAAHRPFLLNSLHSVLIVEETPVIFTRANVRANRRSDSEPEIHRELGAAITRLCKATRPPQVCRDVHYAHVV